MVMGMVCLHSYRKNITLTNTYCANNKQNELAKEGDKMAKRKMTSSSSTSAKSRPALTPEAREQQLIAKATNLAEKQLDEGTASSQVITHFLKLGTEKARLERQKLEHETELLKAKTQSIQATKDFGEAYERAIKAMQFYSGNGDSDEYDY